MINCPKCHTQMAPITVERIAVDRCPSCGGMFFDSMEMEVLYSSRSAGQILDTGAASVGAKQDKKTDIQCPRCDEQMTQVTFVGQEHIQYDSCPGCYGSFFDAGEFRDATHVTFIERLKSIFSANA